MSRYYKDAASGPGGLDHAANIVPLYPEGHSAHERVKVAGHMSQLQRFRQQAENIMTQEDALEKARDEVRAQYMSLEAQRYRFMTISKLLAGMFEYYIDASRADLSEGARHARDYASRLATARLPRDFDDVAKEFFLAHPDNAYCTLAVDREDRW